MDLPIYFISDIHLSLNLTDSEKQRQKKLFDFFNEIKNTGGTLVINGDLFDFYFEFLLVFYSHQQVVELIFRALFFHEMLVL